MPKPGEIVGALQGKQNEQSLLAWVKVTKGIRQAGSSKTVIFDDPLIHAVIADLGGWIRLCRLTERELNFQQREFERLYACYLQRPLRQISASTDRHPGYGQCRRRLQRAAKAGAVRRYH